MDNIKKHNMENTKKKPVTMIVGYLGSGKTTLMNELLKAEADSSLALIVNDMGSVNIDANLIRKDSLVEADNEMVELTNGCICCTLQDAFMSQLENLSEKDSIDRIMVEASGISDPAAIGDAFQVYEANNEEMSFYLDSCVTVVDADRIYNEFFDDLKKKADSGQDEEADVINLVMDQIEFCNVVILNKCDLLSENEIKEVKKLIRSIQKEAEIIECTQGKIDPDKIFSGSKFDFERVMASSAVSKALLRNEAMEGTEKDDFGIHSFTYEEVRPFNYEKFMRFLENNYPEEMIRAKGYIWFSSDEKHVHLFEQAGKNASVTEVSNWVASLPKEEQENFFSEYPEEKETWDPVYGDRKNQIVLIGKGYEKEKIIKMFDDCLE